MPVFPTVTDLKSLTPSAGIRLIGASNGDWAGYTVASAGDVNGDGFADIFIGAQQADLQGRTNSGSAYVVFGKASGWEDINLGNLGSAGFRIDGGVPEAYLGYAISSAGDMNGDGYDEIMVAVGRRAVSDVSEPGSVYVFYGKSSGFTNIDLSAEPGTAGFRIDGQAAEDGFGGNVASAGDVNGDGYDDLIIGAQGGDRNSRTDSGSAYVIFGKSGGFTNIETSSLGSAGFRIDGASAGDFLGSDVSSAGDINGDGFDDFMVSSRNAGPAGLEASGATYVIFGKSGGFSNINLANLGTAGFRLDGSAKYEISGGSISSAGDVNGDGFDDIIIGSEYSGSTDRPYSGNSYVLFGKSGGFGNVVLSALGSNGFKIGGQSAYDGSGRGVASAGDVNGDGYDDLLVGASVAEANGLKSAGKVYVIYGKSSGFADVDLATLGSAGASFNGAAEYAYTGKGPSSAGDVNGDGLDDILVDAWGTTLVYSGAPGITYLMFAQPDPYTNEQQGTAAANPIKGSPGADKLLGLGGDDVLEGGAGNDSLEGGAGSDVLDGGTGNDILVGGAGDDVYVVSSRFDVIREAVNAGVDTVYVTGASYVMAANLEVGRLTGAVAVSLTGNKLDNQLVGNDAGLASTLAGGDGNDAFFASAAADKLDGGRGNDVFYTGGGADTVIGGLGDDQAVIYNIDAVFTELADQGIDTAWVGVAGNYTLGANVEIARLFGDGNSLIGSAGANDLVANVTASTLSGEGGNDTLWGQGGNDTMLGGTGNDIFRTGGGADVCTGGAGNDSYVFFNNGATAIEVSGGGYDIVYQGGAGAFSIGDNIEEARLFDAGNTLTGNGGANLLVGNAAASVNNTISGGGGNDTMFGGAGADTLTGGAGRDDIRGLGGADRFVFSGNWGYDQIIDFSRAEGDKLAISGVTFAQLSIVSGGNTQITSGNNVIYLFGVSSVTASDFIFS